MPPDLNWEPDVLGAEFESAVLHIRHPGGTQRVATLIRHLPNTRDGSSAGAGTAGTAGNARTCGTAGTNAGSAARGPVPGQAVLYLHGWSDYFFNPDLARFWAGLGVAFYALDLHNHGRSLREGDLGGFVGHLQDYDAELRLALDAVAADLTEPPPSAGSSPMPPRAIALMGHSTGGLVAALWASRHPGSVSQLILSSPWLEMYGSALVRHAAYSVVQPFARRWPQKRMRLPERNFYWRSISSQADGEWELDNALRPPKAFPIRVGWMSAILAGQASVAKGLRIRVPILVLMSARSMNGPFWKDAMHTADVVLDVRTMAARAGTLGSSVAIEKIEGGLHDVLLSERAVREAAYDRLRHWVRAYMFVELSP
jgi:alpha-beta hydrolase superfamily lysophospholipase